jgi:hypothetical protein
MEMTVFQLHKLPGAGTATVIMNDLTAMILFFRNRPGQVLPVTGTITYFHFLLIEVHG